MRASGRPFSTRAFSTRVELPCTVLCGTDAVQKLSGTAVRIEPASMVLRIAGKPRALPRVGEKVDLDVHLPVNLEIAGAKDLSIRGLIVEVTETDDGAHQFVLSFRRAQFKDRNGGSELKKRKAASSLEM